MNYILKRKDVETCNDLHDQFCHKYREGYRFVVTNQHHLKVPLYLEIHGFTHDIAQASALAAQFPRSVIRELAFLKTDRFYFMSRSRKT